MKECKVTIAVPVYNGQNVIERCVNSIFEQSYQNIEIIVVMMDQLMILKGFWMA